MIVRSVFRRRKMKGAVTRRSFDAAPSSPPLYRVGEALPEAPL